MKVRLRLCFIPLLRLSQNDSQVDLSSAIGMYFNWAQLLGILQGGIMSYNSDFERAFIERSLALVQDYQGPFDATLLLNCLLGLLIVPKESCLSSIPLDPVEELEKWGISPTAIKNFGTSNGKDNDPRNLRGLVWRLRNSVAHFRFEPVPARGKVEAFNFTDQSGFEATIPLAELRTFVERLAVHIKSL